MKKVRVGLFIDVFYPMIDGVVMVVDNYARELSKYADVIVFAPRYVGKPYDDSKFSYKVVRCMSIKIPFLDYSLPTPRIDEKFMNSLKKYNLDIVHIHSPFTIGKTGLKYALDNHIPCIGTMHSQYRQDFLRAVKSPKIADAMIKTIIKVYNKCTECWAVNKEVARIFHEEYGYKKMPVVMNNATEMLPVRSKEESIKKINETEKLKDEKVFIFVGRINALKNVFFIVDALKIVKEKAKLKFKMFFIGTGQDEEELKKLIKKYDMEKEIKLCGKITNRNVLASYLARSDLFLFPSLYDASSIVQIEAAAQKTPVLFLENAATAATITNEVNGFTSKDDVNEYANRIIQIVNDKKHLEEVSNNAYRDLYHNWHTTITKVYDKYLKIIEKNKLSN